MRFMPKGGTAQMFYCCGITDKGPVRENNEDAFLINRIVMSSAEMESNVSAPMIAAVADGVGGFRRSCLENGSGAALRP